MARVGLGVAMVLAIAPTGCRTSKPPLSEWRACVIKNHRLAPMKPARYPTLHPTPHQGSAVLYMHAKWGESLFVTEYTSGYLMVNLPWPAKKGEVAIEEKGESMYREGGQALYYNSLHMTGRIRIKQKTSKKVGLTIDLEARDPEMDSTDRGTVTLEASVSARVVERTKQCH